MPRDAIPLANSIFNSAVVSFGDGFGSIYYSESPDLKHWGGHRFVMGPDGGWQRDKIGAGPAPLETSEGCLSSTASTTPPRPPRSRRRPG